MHRTVQQTVALMISACAAFSSPMDPDRLILNCWYCVTDCENLSNLSAVKYLTVS